MLRYTSGMGTSLLVSEREYLTTSYEPACEFANGKLVDRHMGELPRSRLMTVVACLLPARDPIPGTPLFIAVEILSPEDRMIRTEDHGIEIPLAELFRALDD